MGYGLPDVTESHSPDGMNVIGLQNILGRREGGDKCHVNARMEVLRAEQCFVTS